MASLINLFYARATPAAAIRIEPSGGPVYGADVQDSLRGTMQEDFQAFARWVDEAEQRLPQTILQAIFQKFLALHRQVVQAYQQRDWAIFQAALVEGKALFAQAHVGWELQEPTGKHWVYRAWSRVLDAEVWFVCCEQEVAQLAKTGVARGSIYTEAELVELLRLPQRPGAEALKSLHAVKSYFDATVVSEGDNDQPEAD